MNASALARDGWMQSFAAAALISGALTVHGLLSPGAPALVAPDGSSPAPAAAALDVAPTGAAQGPSLEAILEQRRRAVAEGVGVSGAAAPAASPSPAAPAQPKLQARTPGRWVVDAAGAAGSDTRSLAAALASAADGDTIVVRPGTYDESLKVAKAVTIDAQEGAEVAPPTPEGVSIAATGPVTIRGLSVRHMGPRLGAGIVIKQGSVSLERVSVRAAPEAAAVAVLDGSLTARGLRLEAGSTGLLVAGTARVEADDVEVRGVAGPAVGLANKATAKLTGLSVTGGDGAGALVKDDARLTLIKPVIQGLSACAVALDFGHVDLEGATFRGDLCPIEFISGGSATSRNGRYDGNQRSIISKPDFQNAITVESKGDRPALSAAAAADPNAQLAAQPAAPLAPFAAAGARQHQAAQQGGWRRGFGHFDIFSGNPLSGLNGNAGGNGQ